MKNLPLVLMYFLVFSLLVHACKQDDSLANQATDTKFSLTSPNGYELANSEADLISKMSAELEPIYGEDYSFTINEVIYLMIEELTSAEVVYTAGDGVERNIIFYWLHNNTTERGLDTEIPPADVVPICKGDCDIEGKSHACKAILIPEIKGWVCRCLMTDGDQDKDAGTCTMVIEGSNYGCTGTCNVAHEDYDCQVAFYYTRDGGVDCVCNARYSAECGTAKPVE